MEDGRRGHGTRAGTWRGGLLVQTRPPVGRWRLPALRLGPPALPAGRRWRRDGGGGAPPRRRWATAAACGGHGCGHPSRQRGVEELVCRRGYSASPAVDSGTSWFQCTMLPACHCGQLHRVQPSPLH